MAGASEKRLREELWPKFLDQRVMNRECDVTGFPRIFTEHAAGNQDPANPNHVLEIHRALRFECDGSQPIDLRSFLKVCLGMRQIKPATAADCIKNRELYVRKGAGRYEFAERGGQCGNFAKFDVGIFPEFVRQIAGGHSAIARVSPTGAGVYTLKIYTYDGTPEDKILADIAAGMGPTRRLYFHGMFTYDYFAIVRTLRAPDRVTWLDPPGWTRVSFPLAFVTFGEASTPEDGEQ